MITIELNGIRIQLQIPYVSGEWTARTLQKAIAAYDRAVERKDEQIAPHLQNFDPNSYHG